MPVSRPSCCGAICRGCWPRGGNSSGLLRRLGRDVLCCHGYKANLLGLLAARRLGIPAVSISRGWTGESFRVRLYEALDRRALRWADKVVCVSDDQAAKVRRAGICDEKIAVIHNAIRPERFADPDPVGRDLLRRLFLEAADSLPPAPEIIVGAAGRLSPEKGFGMLVHAAATVLGSEGQSSRYAVPRVGFVLFGDGPLRVSLERQVTAVGCKADSSWPVSVPIWIGCCPNLDLIVLPSFTEGLPNVALEALAAGVPVVATAVGGTPEVIEDGQTGYLVPPGDAAALAGRILEALLDPAGRSRLVRQGRDCVATRFSFDAQAASYRDLFRQLAAEAPPATNAEAQAEAAGEVRAAS